MKLAYCTNIWNHHQGPVCTELAKLLGPDDFKMLLYQPLDHKYSLERIKMGWNLTPPDEPWIVGPPKTCADVDYSGYVKIVMEADAIVFSGQLPYMTWDMLRARHMQGKLNLRMGERLFKVARPWYWWILPQKQFARWVMARRFRRAGLNFLTMGYWCADDLKYYHANKKRIWRWGYLTSVSATCAERLNHERVRIGWCGRMIDWKHVDYIVKAIAMLPSLIKMKCEVVLVGNGDQEESLKKMVRNIGLTDIITFQPSMSSKEIQSFMRGLDIYVFPSNRMEGWGAALLEAMDKGCAVIANTAAGATLEVVDDGSNGFVFKDGDITTLTERLIWLVEHEKERRYMGRRAWATIQGWSPKAGAYRLVGLVNHLQAGVRDGLPSSGLCAGVR